MDQADRAVALVGRVHDDAERVNVGQVLELDGLAFKLPPNRIGLLLPAINAHPAESGAQELSQLLRDESDIGALFQTQLLQTLFDGGLGLGVSFMKGQSLKLAGHLLHADASGEGCVNLQGFLGDPPPAFSLRMVKKGPQIVQPVRELHQKHAHILAHRQNELLEIGRLFGRRIALFQSRQLRYALDKIGDGVPKQLGDLFARGFRVFDRVVKQTCDDGRSVETVLGQDPRHLNRMREIGIA
jgi:hypothetical protein